MTISNLSKPIILIAACLATYIVEAKTDLFSAMQQHREPKARGASSSRLAIVRITDAARAHDVANEVNEVQRDRGTLLLVEATDSQLEALAKKPWIADISYREGRVRPMMDKVRSSVAADKVQAGTEVVDGRRYLGAGVLTALVDQGLDPNHLNFTDAEGKSRFEAVWTYNENDGTYTEYIGDDAIAGCSTDMPSAFHGTYTCGIMAGSYDGKATVALSDANGTVSVLEGNMPYRGIAPEARIVGGVGVLADANIISAVENIIDYSKSVGLRPVINLSIGSPGGPFDLGDPLCAYLNEVGKEDAVIVAAAGNDGHKRMSIDKRFSATDMAPVLSFFDGLGDAGSESPRTLYLQVWSDDDRHPCVELVSYDPNAASECIKSVYTVTDDLVYLTTDPEQVDETTVYSSDLAAGFNGLFVSAREINEVNGRSCTIMMFSLSAAETNNGRLLGIRISGKPGERHYITTDGTLQLSGNNVPGAVNGNADLSISTMVCADNILSVGAYVSRTSSPCLNGSVRNIYNYFYDAADGAPAYFSSYATLPDGRNYPTVTAPGNEVISSYSRYYTSQLSDAQLGGFTAKATDANGVQHYWQSECGTSAATPVVAGVVATWLEADPTLTTADVIDIISKTAVSDSYTQNVGPKAKWGYGKIDALAGLNEVLSRKAGVDGIIADNSEQIRVLRNGNEFTVSVFGASHIAVKVYDIAGRLHAVATDNGENLNLDLGTMLSGIYIINVEADLHGSAMHRTIKAAIK